MVENPQNDYLYVYEDEFGNPVIVEVVEVKDFGVLVKNTETFDHMVLSREDLQDDPEQIINISYLNGWTDSTEGNTEYGSGHYIFDEVNGKYYAVQTISTGAKYLIEFDDIVEWEVAQQSVIDEYADLEDEDGNLIIE